MHSPGWVIPLFISFSTFNLWLPWPLTGQSKVNRQQRNGSPWANINSDTASNKNCINEKKKPDESTETKDECSAITAAQGINEYLIIWSVWIIRNNNGSDTFRSSECLDWELLRLQLLNLPCKQPLFLHSSHICNRGKPCSCVFTPRIDAKNKIQIHQSHREDGNLVPRVWRRKIKTLNSFSTCIYV